MSSKNYFNMQTPGDKSGSFSKFYSPGKVESFNENRSDSIGNNGFRNIRNEILEQCNT